MPGSSDGANSGSIASMRMVPRNGMRVRCTA
jgi:hypothetical protein